MTGEINFKKLSAIISISVLVVLTFFILRPIIFSIITGLLFGYVFYPLYKKVNVFVREKNISAFFITILVFLLFFLPLWFLIPLMIEQAFNVYLYLQRLDVTPFLRGILPQNLVDSSFYPNIVAVVSGLLSNTAGYFSGKLSSSFLTLPNMLLQLLIFFFTLFYVVRDGDKLKEYIKSLSPFSKKAEDKLLNDFKNITNSVIYGSIFAGFVIGVVMGLGFLIFKIPNALILTIISILAAIIPIIGVWIVWIPLSIWLIASGNTTAGVGLAVYSIVTTFALESFIRSYFISRKGAIHSVIALIGMIGGLIFFGVLGLILGPLILSYLLMILEAYKNRDLYSLFS
jgi:predicted PurR-regulated permease PerM